MAAFVRTKAAITMSVVRTNSASVQSLGSGVEADLHWHQQQQLPMQNLPGVNPQSEAARNAIGALKIKRKWTRRKERERITQKS